MRDFQHTSYSEMDTLSSCERKWWYRYLKDADQEQSAAQYRGSALHRLIASYRVGEREAGEAAFEAAIFADEIEEEDAARIRYVYDRYVRLYPNTDRIVATELFVESELPDSGLTVVTYVDEVVQLQGGGLWAVERKSMKDWRRLNRLSVDPQVTIVLWNLWNNDWPVQGLVYDAVRTHVFAGTKPTQAQLKETEPKLDGEKNDAYLARLRLMQEDRRIEEPLESSFQQSFQVRNEEHVAEALAEIDAHVARRTDLIVGDRQPMRNIDQHCDWCDHKHECWSDLAFGQEIEVVE